MCTRSLVVVSGIPSWVNAGRLPMGAHVLTAWHACMQRRHEATNAGMKQLFKNMLAQLQSELLGNMVEAFSDYPDKHDMSSLVPLLAQLLPDEIGK